MPSDRDIRCSINKRNYGNTDADRALDSVQQRFMDVFSTRDVDAIADLYHPGAVLTRSDGLCFYGRDAVIADYKPFVDEVRTFELIPSYNSATPDGLYLLQQGTYKVNGGDEKKYEQVFKKADDGRYLLYHDDFEMP